MYRTCLLLAFLTLFGTGVRAQVEEYEQQAEVITTMLEKKNFRGALQQAEALITSGEQAQLPLVVAEGRYLLGRILTDNPRSSAKDRVRGIREMRLAAQAAKAGRDGELLDRILQRLEQLTGSQAIEVEELPSVKQLRGDLPSGETIDDAAITAIVSLQDRAIEALNDSQMRQMLRLREQQRELDQYAFKALNDSLALMQQEMLIRQQEAEADLSSRQRNLLIVLVLAALTVLGLLYSRFRTSQRFQEKLQASNEAISAERQRSEELLLNILPVTVAAELKDTGKATARRYESATVLFADFKGFSTLAATLEPEVLISYLDEAFRAFDKIVRTYGLEKIKTIGDAYMCAGGLPEESEDHAARMVQAALDMQAYLSKNPHFSARIGIHTGPVVAGVVGQDKFVYDIWGDTVNQASRLEVAGEPGRVAASQAVVDAVGGKFRCEEAGTFEAKNIGKMKRYFVSHKSV